MTDTGRRSTQPKPTDSTGHARAAHANRPARDGSAPPIPRGLAALAGIAVVAVAFAVAELLAALGIWAGWLHADASPLQALGSGFIRITPEWLKEWAIRQFGTNDKVALRVGVVATIAGVAAILGLIARRAVRLACAVLLILVAVIVATVWVRVAATAIDTIPTIVAGAAALAVLTRFFPAARREPSAPPAQQPEAGVAGGTNRRRFLRNVALTGAAATAAGGAAALIPTTSSASASRARLSLPTPADQQPLPADMAIPGQTPLVTSNADFYRIDTSLSVPTMPAESWRLELTGEVDRPLTLSFGDLLERPLITRAITLTCVSNEVGGTLAGTAEWTGIRLADLLAEAGIRPGADCLLSGDRDGFTVTTPLDALTDGRDAMLAIGMNGEPLPLEHGFPVRMVVPGLYGYVSATKWVTSMRVTRFSQVSAYWTERGWSDHGPIKTASRIDTPAAFATLKPGTVTIAGVAWAQHRGIASVQVQVDDGPWQEATISRPLSKDIWVQWHLAWTATEGQHTLRVRCTDGDGVLQTEQRADPIPNGSSGWHSRQVKVA